MRSPIVIRKANEADVPGLARVYLDSVTTAYDGMASPEYVASRNLEDCLEQWTRNLRDESASVLVAESQKGIEGLASFGEARDEDGQPGLHGEIQTIYVSPSRWGQGIGQRLCSAAMDQLYAEGADSILLWVLERNGRARSFYERAGFVADGKTMTVRMGWELAAVRYRHP
ncbi:MAG: GNAT family N-acetyltransferase [Verrucomicrobiota bacterium]